MNPWLLFGNTQFQSLSFPKCIEIFAIQVQRLCLYNQLETAKALRLSSYAFFSQPTNQVKKKEFHLKENKYLQDVMVLNGIPIMDMQRSVMTKLIRSR